MELCYNGDISKEAINTVLCKKLNQIYKLLPMREEGGDWERLVDILVEEFSGMTRILPCGQDTIFSLLCMLAGLKFMAAEKDFPIFRRTVLESTSLCGKLMKDVCSGESQ